MFRREQTLVSTTIVTIPRSGCDRSFIRDLSVTFPGRYPFVISSIFDGDDATGSLGAGPWPRLPRGPDPGAPLGESSPGRTVSERRVHETQDSVGRPVLGGAAGPGRVRRQRRLQTPGATPSNFNPGATGNSQDPNAKGPVTIAGAQKGGTVTVLTLTGLTTTIDPSEIYYTDTSSIMSGLVDAVADAVQVRPEDQADGAGARPGHRPRAPTTTTTPSGRSRSAPV